MDQSDSAFTMLDSAFCFIAIIYETISRNLSTKFSNFRVFCFRKKTIQRLTRAHQNTSTLTIRQYSNHEKEQEMLS